MILEPQSAEGQALAKMFQEADVRRFIADKLTDEDILAIVVQDLGKAEQERHHRNLPLRWDENDKLYLFQVPQRKWEGTKYDRASLGVPLVLEHVNAIAPHLMDIIFEEDPPFHAMPHPGTTMMEARANEEVLSWEIDKSSMEEELESGIFEGLIDGDFLVKAFWAEKDGYVCPHFENVEKKFVFVDPALRRPDVRKARFVIHRMYKTPKQLEQLRGEEGVTLPPYEELLKLGIPPQEQAPYSQTDAPTQRYGSMSLSQEFESFDQREPVSINPENHPLEVLEYTTKSHVWTILQRKHVIRKVQNKKNRSVLWLSGYFTRVRGQFHGIGIGPLIGNEQRLQQGLINSMLDALALSLRGIILRKKGHSVMQQPTFISPGKVFELDDVKDMDVLKLPPPDFQIFQTIADSDQRSARRTGANEVSVQGTFPETTAGLGRTAFGMNMLSQGASARIRKFVKTIERQVIIPFLEWLVDTNPLYLDEALVEKILSPELLEGYYSEEDGEYYDGVNITQTLKLGSKMKFKMFGSTKMKRRASMIQSVPLITQLVQQENILEMLKLGFKKPDINEIIWMIFDATGWPNKEQVIVDMSEEEIMQIMSENETLSQLMVERQRLMMEAEKEIRVADAKNAGIAFRDLLRAVIEKQVTLDQAREQMQLLQGQEAANAELDAEISQIQSMGGQVG